MKKLLLALFLLPAAAWAQPNLVSSTPAFGDSITAYLFEYPVPTYAKSGNNNWDFSPLPTTAVNQIGVKFVNPANTPYAADFPTSTICQKLTAGPIEAYLFGRSSADSLWQLGSRYPTMSVLDETFVDPDVAYRFPFSLNQVQTDVWSNTAGDVDSSRQKYVGWGNIKTPYGDYNNVVLLEDYTYNTVNNTWEVEDYTWISAVNLMDVAQIDAGDTSGTWFTWQTASTATQDFLMNKYSLSIYPNPSTTESNIAFNLNTEAPVSVQLISVDGKSNTTLVSEKRRAGKHVVPVNTANLAAGTYFVRVLIDNQPMVKTLTVVK